MSKFYAVKVGREKGIYTSWSETEKQVNGFSGAMFKAFKTKEEAQFYMDNPLQGGSESVKHKETTDLPQASSDELYGVEVYVDGSYSNIPPIYGSGWVAVEANEVINKKSFSGDDERYIESRQVPGEVFACIDAISWAKECGYDRVTIYYDYEGIKNWATKAWSATKNISRDYLTLFENVSQDIIVEFIKVKAHSGDVFNEIADKLAKSALLKRGVRSNGDGSVTMYGVDREELEIVFKLIDRELPNFKLFINTERDGCVNFTLNSEEHRVVINCYDTGKTVVQGKDSSFMQYTLTLLIQLCENDEVIETLNAFNNVSVNIQVVEDKFNEVLPNYKQSSIKLDTSLKQAAYNLTISGTRYDYSDLPMPILRALEHYLHLMLRSIGLKTVNVSGANNFSYFDCVSEIYFLQQAHATKFNDNNKVKHLNKIYNFYNQHRHTLFHWNEESEDTRVLSSIEDARDLIVDGFALIDEYYVIY